MAGKIEKIIYFGSKVSEKHLDGIVDDFFKNYSKTESTNKLFVFDFSDVEYISNQELLVFTAILDSLIESKVSFKVRFLKNGSRVGIDKRKAKQLVEIWEVWRIGQIVTNTDYESYFDINSNIIARIKRDYSIFSERLEIFNRFGITPFIRLSKIDKYEDRRIGEMLEKVYQLNEAISEIIRVNNCELPFKNKTLSLIITKELYENFLDHFVPFAFNSDNNKAYMSLSLKGKLNEKVHNEDSVQKILERNISDEMPQEFKNFFWDKKVKKYKNQSLLQLSFLDFGTGITVTLKKEYEKWKANEFLVENRPTGDSEILNYAFRYDSSQHPIDIRYLERASIPRGLFDLITIVKRYSGMIVARSNYGKILYDFSNNASIEEALHFFGDDKLFFPGTLITIYLPETSTQEKFDVSVIKPNVKREFTFKKREIKRISVFEIQKQLSVIYNNKDELYRKLFETLTKQFVFDGKETLIYVDFEGFEIDERISRKIIYFLITDYNINESNSVIVINPPPKSFLDLIKEELVELSIINKNFYIHPTPFIYLDRITSNLNIYWLGIFSDSDINKLNDLLLEINDLRRSDFEQPEGMVGNVNFYDKNGNLQSLINSEAILELLKGEIANSKQQEVQDVILRYIKKADDELYLCTGNYYQNEYLQLYDALNDQQVRDYLLKAFADTLAEKIVSFHGFHYVSITSSSQKLASYFIEKGYIDRGSVTFLNNYHLFYTEENFRKVPKGSKVILLCDVISTGYLTTRLEKYLKEVDADLVHIAVLIDGTDENFEPEKTDYLKLRKKVISLFSYKMSKYRRKDIIEGLLDSTKKVVRINPYTNTPITLGEDQNLRKNILLSNEEFIDLIDEKNIKAGYFKFNNLIHPYFFDMENILRDKAASFRLLKTLFDKIPKEALADLELIFFPKNSAIRNIDFNVIKDHVLKNQRIGVFELERFSTTEGWRFPHPSEHLFANAKGRKVLIIDDGSCTGESIVQMIDEVCFLKVREIIVLSIIGRVTDHKRDFFSRLRVVDNSNSTIPISVFFGSHWNVPTYYIEESPIIKEKNWLEKLVSFFNLPSKLNLIATRVLDELQLKDIGGPNNRYLIKNKDDSPIIKQLILSKEQIGKITTYRFYKEQFYFFNDLVLTYDRKEMSYDRYQRIELVCAVFIHEPELFEKVRTVVPDLTDKVEEFVLTILFGNPNKARNPKLNIKNLFHKWSNKNLLHLFFLVFKDERLFELLDATKLASLISDFCKTESDLSYLLYRLLKYIPLHISEVENRVFGGRVKSVVETVAESSLVEQNSKSHLKIFGSFISTLPINKSDFNSHLLKIKNNYKKLVDDEFHNEYIYNDKQILISQLTVLDKMIRTGESGDKEISGIKNAWSSISVFLEDLLNFSVSFPSFFLPLTDKNYENFESIHLSLRSMHGKLNDFLYSENFAEISEIKELINELFDNFIMGSSKYPEIFAFISTPDIQEEFAAFVIEIRKVYPSINLRIVFPEKTAISFPKVYLKEIVFKEIKGNLRHADLAKEVVLSWQYKGEDIIFEIENSYNTLRNIKGGGKGISKLNSLNSFPIKTKYAILIGDSKYLQTITFKIA
jgi:orotate phosphoribosyltransferase